MAETGTARLIGIAIPTLRELRGATIASLSAGPSGETDAVDALREAGYAGGGTVYEAFEQWLLELESSAAPDLTLDEFGERAAEYFRAAGWGLVEFDSRHDDGIATLTIADCWEVDSSSTAPALSCHVTTGMLAAFFGRLAGYPVSVMETECSSTGAERCSFILGNSHVMTFKWEELA
ncbi:MAG TPA: V4R domain-containing protein [Gemmatimonadaceae bacterium]|nr:V4R domain-containing protein [Gemmatimonadaceae bacterium]